jgi:hypothetical protein
MKKRMSSTCTVALLLAAGLALSAITAGTAVAAPLGNTWYLAEGSTAWGFGTEIAIENPNSILVIVAVRYTWDVGYFDKPLFAMSPYSRVTIFPADDIGAKDFSTRIYTTGGEPIAVDRTMFWMGGPGTEEDQVMETHSSVAVDTLSTQWYLPEGSSSWGFETWLTVQNPGPAATCNIRYMIEGAASVVFPKTLPANSRKTFNMKDDIGEHDASILVSCPAQPVVAEVSMYRNSRREGTCSIGAVAPMLNFYMAEGTTAWGFTTYVVVQNPNVVATNVDITYMKPTGPVHQPTFTMPPLSRETVRVNDYCPDTDLSIHVHGSNSILAERAMYWGGNTVYGEAAHASIGVSAAHATFYLPGGDCRDLMETWTCVQNPNGNDISVQITYFRKDGAGLPVTFSDVVPANSRKSFNMADKVSPGQYAIRVSSLWVGKDIIAERATYVYTEGMVTSRTAGSDTIGAFSDP